MNIDYAVGECALGHVLIGTTRHGVCALFIADTQADVTAELLRAFPKAHLRDTSNNLLSDALPFLHGQSARFPYSLDLQGTPFQHRVWEALRHIPYGTIQTYQGLACAIDSPKAIRAVASACAANKVAIAIPCHRIIRSNGDLGGYRWGIHRKIALLEREKAPMPLHPIGL